MSKKKLKRERRAKQLIQMELKKREKIKYIKVGKNN